MCLAPKSLFKIILIGYIEGLNEGAVSTQDWQTQCETKLLKKKKSRITESSHSFHNRNRGTAGIS